MAGRPRAIMAPHAASLVSRSHMKSQEPIPKVMLSVHFSACPVAWGGSLMCQQACNGLHIQTTPSSVTCCIMFPLTHMPHVRHDKKSTLRAGQQKDLLYIQDSGHTHGRQDMHPNLLKPALSGLLFAQSRRLSHPRASRWGGF